MRWVLVFSQFLPPQSCGHIKADSLEFVDTFSDFLKEWRVSLCFPTFSRGLMIFMTGRFPCRLYILSSHAAFSSMSRTPW